VSMKKVESVDSVNVSLNEGLAKVHLKAGNTVRLEHLREVIEKNGFTPRKARVTVLGEVVSVDGILHLKITGLDQRYTLAIDPNARRTEAELKKLVGKILLVEGVIVSPKEEKTPQTLRVTTFKELGEKK